MAGFDQKCPFCNHDIDCRAAWDYQTDYVLVCGNCERDVQVNVHSEPVFETSKPSCPMCDKTLKVGDRHYCVGCREKLSALSEHNKQAAKVNAE
jgi:hypothetical protein